MKNTKRKMDYFRIYNELIERSRHRNLESYTEVHHIIPRCLNGDSSEENLAILTAREHFIAHLLLCKIHPNHKGLRLALWMMTNVKDEKQQRHLPNSKLYEMIRLEYSESVSGENNPNYGKTHSLETREKMSRKAKERIGEKNAFYGKTHSLETREKIKSSLTGFKHSEETRMKMSEVRKGKKKNFKTITCSICGKEGKGPNMSRYHFNNCKNKV